MNSVRSVRVGLLLGAICSPNVVAAQTVNQVPSPNVAQTEIIVTAAKREQTLQDAPFAVSVLSGDTLENTGVRQFTDLQVPGLQITNNVGGAAITIRGLGSGQGNLSFEQSVGLFVDGVYSSRARSFQNPFLDIERIEVVRGPQGALFGKNTNAGAVSIVTRKPTPNFEAEVRAGYEIENSGWLAQGFVSGPVSDTLSLRLTGKYQYVGDFIDNRLTNVKEGGGPSVAGRFQALWEPSGRLNVLFKAEVGRTRSATNLMYNGIGSCRVCLAALQAGGGPGFAQETPAFFRTSRTTRPEKDIINTQNYSITLNADIGNDWLFTSISSYQRLKAYQAIDTDAGALTFLATTIRERSSSYFQELRVLGTVGDSLTITAGATFIRSNLNINQVTTFDGPSVPIPGPLAGISDRRFDQNSTSISPYGVVELDLTSSFSIEGSLRYGNERKTGRAEHVTTGILPPTNLPFDLSGKLSEDLWDYSAKLRYNVASFLDMYLSYATGTKSGGFVSNDGALLFNIQNNGARLAYLPEKARSWELGAKFQSDDRSLAVNLAIFNTRFTDLQVSQFNGTAFTTSNAAAARSRGVEADAVWRPAEAWEIGGSVAYIDAKYLDYPGASCLFAAPATCTPATNNLAGTVLTRAPKWKSGGYVQLTQPIGDDLHAQVRASANYTSRLFFQPNLNPLASQPGVTLIDGRVSIGEADDNWTIALIGRNLTNRVILTQGFSPPAFSQNTMAVSIDRGRTVMLEGTIKF